MASRPCGSNDDCYDNHSWITELRSKSDYSVHKDCYYLFVKNTTFVERVTLPTEDRDKNPQVAEEFNIRSTIPDWAEECSCKDILQTSLGDEESIYSNRKNNYFVVYAILDLIALEYKRQDIKQSWNSGINWKFSVQDVIDNLDEDDLHDISKVLTYIDQNGLCLDGTTCTIRYHIESFDKINGIQNNDVYEALKNQPLYVEAWLNPQYFQFYEPGCEHPVHAGCMRPTYAGVLTGFGRSGLYKYANGYYWQMYIRRHGKNMNSVKLTARYEKKDENGNTVPSVPFAGISSKMYRVTVPEKLPTPMPLSWVTSKKYTNDELVELIQDAIDAVAANDSTDPTTIYLDAQYLDCANTIYNLKTINGISNVIINDPECIIDTTGSLTYSDAITRRLQDATSDEGVELNYLDLSVKSIYFAPGLYNDKNYKIRIERCHELKSIVIGESSLGKTIYLSIGNNTKLLTVDIGTNALSDHKGGWTWFDIKSAEFYMFELPILKKLEIRKGSMGNFLFVTIANVETDEEDFELHADNAFANMKNYYYDGDIHKVIHDYFLTVDDDKKADIATPVPPTAAPAVPPYLIVDDDAKCEELATKKWETIEVKEGMCNNYKTALVIDDYHHLKSIKIADNALMNLNKLEITKNIRLTEVVIGTEGETAAFSNVQSILIQGNPFLTSITFGSKVGATTKSLIIDNLPQFTSLTFGTESFAAVDEVVISNLPELETLTIPVKAFEKARTLVMEELKLGVLSIGDDAFKFTWSVALTNVIFTEGTYIHGTDSFKHLPEYGITADEASERLSLCIANDECPETDSTLAPKPEGVLIVALEEHCEQLATKTWTHIIVGNGLCNEMTSFDLSGYTKLESFEVYYDSFQNVKTLTVSNNDVLTSLKLHTDSTVGKPFVNVESLTISDNKAMVELVLDADLFDKVTSFTIKNMAALTTLTLNENTFTKATNAVFENLPEFAAFTASANVFSKLIEMTIKNVNFTSDAYTPGDNAFGYLSFYGIDFDEVSKQLVACIINGCNKDTLPNKPNAGVIIKTETDCSKLWNIDSNWGYILVLENLCNGDSYKKPFSLKNHQHLEYVAIGTGSMKQVPAVTIEKNVKLHSFVVSNNAFVDTTSISITNFNNVTLDALKTITIGEGSFLGLTTITLKDTTSIETFKTEDEATVAIDDIVIENFVLAESADVTIPTFNVTDDSILYDEASKEIAACIFNKVCGGSMPEHILPGRALKVGTTGCDKLVLKKWTAIEINSACEDVEGIETIVIDRTYENLKSVVVADSALTSTKSFTVEDNDKIETIVFGEGALTVSSMTIDALPALTELSIGKDSFYEGFNMNNLAKLETIVIGEGAFKGNSVNITEKVEIKNLPAVKNITVGSGAFASAKELLIEGLPVMDTLIFESNAFPAATSLSLKNLPKLNKFEAGTDTFKSILTVSTMGSSFTEGVFTGKDSFESLGYALVFDEVSVRLARCIYNKECNDTMVLPDFLQPGGGLKVNDEESCGILFNSAYNLWTSIEVEANKCNTTVYTKPLEIINYSDLVSLKIHEGSLTQVTSLSISGNEKLKKVEIAAGTKTAGPILIPPQMEEEEGEFRMLQDNNDTLPENAVQTYIIEGSFVNAATVVIENNPELTSFDFKDYTFHMTTSLTLKNLPKITKFTNGQSAFENLKTLEFSELPLLNEISIAADTFLAVDSDVDFTELPKLATLTIGNNAMKSATSLALNESPALTTLRIGENSFSPATMFVAENITTLKTIEIGSGAFVAASKLVINGLSSLETFKTGNNCFNPELTTETPTEFTFEAPAGLVTFVVGGNNLNFASELTLKGLNKLATIQIGNNSFNTTEATFENLNALKKLSVGNDALTESKTLVMTSTVLESIELGNKAYMEGERLSISGLTALKTLKIGDYAFTKIKTSGINSSNIPSIETISIGSNCFDNYGNKFTFENYQNMVSFTVGSNTLNDMNTITLKNLPNFTTLEVGEDSLYETELNLANLPKFNKLSVGNGSFGEIEKAVNIDNVLFLDGVYTGTTFSFADGEQVNDNTTCQRLKKCIEKKGCTAVEEPCAAE